MSRKPSPNFDPDWYAAAYPDVALSGLSPHEHYARFGRMLGRPGSGKPVPRPVAPVEAVSSKVEASSSNTSVEAAPPVTAAPVSTRAVDPIIGRPAGLDLSIASPVPAASEGCEAELFSTDALVATPFADENADQASRAALAAYKRIILRSDGDTYHLPDAATHLLRTGPMRIDNAWFVTSTRLRLAIRGGTDGLPIAAGNRLRAYQGTAKIPDALRRVELGGVLAARGPLFLDLELADALMPLLLELVNGNDESMGMSLVPFPSLMPGGLHGAELKALQTEPNPMDDFWAMSDLLLRELLDGADRMPRSITGISGVEGRSADVGPWLQTVFGLQIDAENAANDTGLRLQLPPDCVPTICGLVSRRLRLGSEPSAVGPYLVAEANTSRPRWCVTLPAGFGTGADVPRMEQSRDRVETSGNPGLIPVPLAIAFRTTQPVKLRSTEAHRLNARSEDFRPRPTTILVDSSDVARTNLLIERLKAWFDDIEHQVIVRADNVEAGATNLDGAIGRAGISAFSGLDLRALACNSSNDQILTISDRIDLDDPTPFAEVERLLLTNPASASVSCLLLHEVSINKQRVLQPASGGLFPSRIAFDASPRLAFAEPDVSEALRDLAYPVAANTLFFTLWRRSALAKLPERLGSVPGNATDIRIGLDLLEAGHSNICTTQVAVRIGGAYDRRDAVDPLGEAYVGIDRWQDILKRVTVVRGLY